MKHTTVVIPNLNGMKYLEGCMTSLFSCEKETEFDVIVVDNGSTDGSTAYLKKHFPGVQLIAFSENTGFCKAVNAGILAAKTRYVILLNNDTTVENGFVSNLTKAIMENAGIFSVGARLVSMQNPEVMDDAGDYYCALGWAFAAGKGKPASHYDKKKKIFAACGGAAIYDKILLDKTGLFDENHFAYLEDIDLGYRAKISGYQNLYEPSAVAHHAGSAASGSRYNAFKINLTSRNSVYLIGKNMPLLQLLLNLPFLVTGFLIKYLFFLKMGFGGLYLKGLWKGIRLTCSEKGRKQKVRFLWRNIGNYILIEGELLWNIIRRLGLS